MTDLPRINITKGYPVLSCLNYNGGKTPKRGIRVGEPLQKYGDLREGMWIALQAPHNAFGKVGSLTESGAYAFILGNDWIAFLNYDTGQGCWICSGSGSLRAIKKLELFSKEKQDG